MVRTVVGYSPAGDLKDHHELARVLARLRSGGMKQPQKVVEEMVHHASALLKLFADDATMGVVVPELEVEAAKDRRNKQRREQALQEALAGRP